MTQTARWNVRDDLPVPAGLTQGSGWLLIEDASEPDAPSFWVCTGTTEDGRVILTGLVLADPEAPFEVTTKALRAIRVPEVVRAINWRAVGGPPPASVGAIGPTGLARFEGVAQAIESAPEPAAIAPKQGQAPTEDELRRVVEVYRRHRGGPSPIAATLDELDFLTRITLQRWLDRAQERGIFPEGRRGRPTTTERSAR